MGSGAIDTNEEREPLNLAGFALKRAQEGPVSRARLARRVGFVGILLSADMALIVASSGAAQAGTITDGALSSPASSTVVDEALAFTSLSTPLSNLFVVLESIIVTESPGGIVFVEGVDYVIEVIGPFTWIQLTPAGAIDIGDTVFVSYAYVPEPSTASLLAFGLVALASLGRRRGADQ